MEDDPNTKLEKALTEALESPLSDGRKTLDTIVNAIVNKSVDKHLIAKAVKDTVQNYENQLRVFMISVATNHLPRITKLLDALDRIDEEMRTPRILQQMDASQLLKSYALMQATLTQSLDYVKKVADMRIELETSQSSIVSSMSDTDVDEINKMSGLPKLNAVQRNKVRTFIEGFIITVNESEESASALSTDKSNGEKK